MLLLDDGDKQVIEPIGRKAAQMEPVYDFELMEESGRLRGWLSANDGGKGTEL